MATVESLERTSYRPGRFDALTGAPSRVFRANLVIYGSASL